MSDPTAQVVVSARDATAAAINSANRNIRKLAASGRSLKTVFAGLGVVFSARAFAGWIKGSLDAKEMTDAQTKATESARVAMRQMGEASDGLARSLATSLAPAMERVGQILVGLNAAFFNADPSPFGKEIADLQEQLADIDKHAIDTGIGTLLYTPEQVAEQKRLVAEMEGLKKKQFEALTGGATGQDGSLETFIAQVEFEEKLREDQAKAAAEIAKTQAEQELQWATVLAEEKERFHLEELTQEQNWAGVLAEERERVHVEELAQEQDWAETLAAERERAADMEVEQFIAKEGLLTEAKREGEAARAEFVKQSQGQQVASVFESLEQMTAGIAQHSKKAFQVNKMAAIANAIVNTAQGATRALAAYPPPVSFAMAAAQIAAGAAQISAIKSTTFGAGTTPSAAGSTPTVNGNPVQQGSGQIITVRGIGKDELFTGRQLIDLLNQATKDGAKLVFQN